MRGKLKNIILTRFAITTPADHWKGTAQVLVEDVAGSDKVLAGWSRAHRIKLGRATGSAFARIPGCWIWSEVAQRTLGVAPKSGFQRILLPGTLLAGPLSE
jgi:hypothetical protein